MAPYRVGIIGCGRPWRADGATGFGMSHQHAIGYRASPAAQIVALADIVAGNARAFQAQHGGDAIYTDYHEMLARERLDIVSISTWPHLHAPMVIAAAEAGVRAIHCEKPMAPTFGEARQMVAVCADRGVQLTFNHQRRFGTPFRRARELLRAGAIGTLQRIECSTDNLFDWGTHWFDMACFFNDETPVEWVIGQIDLRDAAPVFGVPVERHGISQFRFANGVEGLMLTGRGAFQPLGIRLSGSSGIIELGHSDAVPLRVLGGGRGEWQSIPVDEGLHGADCVTRGVLDLIDALAAGREPELSAARALRATELIFATYESSRRGARVELPLTIDDSPLIARLTATTS